MMRLIGIAVIAITAAYLGITASLRLSKRVSELKSAVLMIDRIKTCLMFEKAHTKDILSNLCAQTEFSCLRFLLDCNNAICANANISQVWKECVKKSQDKLHLEKSDLNLLICVGNILGSADSKSQIDELNLISGFLQKNTESALAAEKARGKLYRSLGILSGIGIAIVLI